MSAALKLFLAHILPLEGWKVAIVKTSNRMEHYWFESIDEQARCLKDWSVRGLDTYHACASYKEKGTLFSGRTQSNVHQVRALWADIDTREGKLDAPYVDRAQAAEALGKFCRQASLPRPVVVTSGYGLHAYWPFLDPVAPTEWVLRALQLKARAAQLNFMIDAALTANAAAILRTPGTTNYKAVS